MSIKDVEDSTGSASAERAWREFTAAMALRLRSLSAPEFLELALHDDKGWHSRLHVKVTSAGRVLASIDTVALRWRNRDECLAVRAEVTDLGWQWLPRAHRFVHDIGRRRVDDLAVLMTDSLQQLWHFTGPEDVTIRDPFGDLPETFVPSMASGRQPTAPTTPGAPFAPVSPPSPGDRTVRHLRVVPDLPDDV